MTPARVPPIAFAYDSAVVPGVAGGVALDRDDVRDAATGDELATHRVAGGLRSDEDHVDALRSVDVAEADVEAVREGEGLARGQVRGDRLAVDRALVLVRREDHDEVGPLRSPRRRS